jgi:hypothetical protein
MADTVGSRKIGFHIEHRRPRIGIQSGNLNNSLFNINGHNFGHRKANRIRAYGRTCGKYTRYRSLIWRLNLRSTPEGIVCKFMNPPENLAVAEISQPLQGRSVLRFNLETQVVL